MKIIYEKILVIIGWVTHEILVLRTLLCKYWECVHLILPLYKKLKTLETITLIFSYFISDQSNLVM